jgi:adenosylhomocysteine nucleosidase
MIRVAIIAALPGELKPLVRGWPHERRAGVELWRRRRGDAVWIAACAGIGVEAATRALAETEREGAADGVVSAGWAGALRAEFASGRAYGVTRVIDARTGESFSAAGRLEECRLVTSDRVADQAEKQRLAAAYGAGLVDMEAAAVARWAAGRGIPFHCIKGVSDGPADPLPDFNGFISADGQFARARFMSFALFRPRHWRALLRLDRNSRKAAVGIGQAVRQILERADR